MYKYFLCFSLHYYFPFYQCHQFHELNAIHCIFLQYFDSLPGVSSEELGKYGGTSELADYCPFHQVRIPN